MAFKFSADDLPALSVGAVRTRGSNGCPNSPKQMTRDIAQVSIVWQSGVTVPEMSGGVLVEDARAG
jgi:hypothetical protein